MQPFPGLGGCAWGPAEPILHAVNLQGLIVSDPAILDGTPVFAGTRVPIRSLLDHLRNGEPLDRFLAEFPSVTKEQAVAVLEAATDALTGGESPSR